MAKYSSSINYKITTSLDASGITKLQAELNRLEHEFTSLGKRQLMPKHQVNEAVSDIKRIERALQTAFNPKLGMMNTGKLMSELTAGGRSLNQIYNSLGTRGSSAMAQLYGQLGKIDTGMKSVSKTTDKLFNTLGNTVRWGVIASGFQYVLNSAHQAVSYMSDLDESLTNIRMVTDESKESMRQFARYANEAAKSLGNTTVAYTDAALIYAQQGYGLNDQKILANYTLMTANATGQDTKEVSTQMTSMINGFKLSVDEVGGALDVLAKVANTSAADMEELSTATAKVASTANTLGVTQEQLTAQIATIVSVTREAPENVGNALKTIYARFGDLQLGETLEDGSDLGKVSSTLEKIGVQVLDDSGAMREMGAIMEDLMAVWDTLNTADKQATAVTIAGKYQYNRLMALMENSDMYEGYLDDAYNSEGTLDTMQSEYMESLEGKTNALIASLQGALSALFNQDSLGPFIDGLTEIVDKFTTLVDAIGGGSQALMAFSGIAMKMFSGNVGRSLSNIVSNRQTSRAAADNIASSQAFAKQQLAGTGLTAGSANVQTFVKDTATINQYAGTMNQEQIERANIGLEKRKSLLLQLTAEEEKYNAALATLKVAYVATGVAEEAAEKGLISYLQTLEAGDAGLEDFKATVAGTRDTLLNLQMGFTGLQNEFTEAIAKTEGVESSWTGVQDKARVLASTIAFLGEDLKKLGITEQEQIVINEMLEKAVAGDIDDYEAFSATVKEATAIIDKYTAAMEKTTEAVKKLDSATLKKMQGNLQQTKNAFEAASKEAQHFAAQLQMQSTLTQITNMASGVMNLVFAFQSLKNIGSILNNEDLTAAERLEQLLMNGSMMIVMLIPALTSMREAWSVLTSQLALHTIAQEKDALATAASSAATAAATAATTASGTAELTEEQIKLRKIQEDLKGAQIRNGVVTPSKLAEIAATYDLSAAEIQAIAVTEGYTVANEKLFASLVKIATPFLAIAAAAAVVGGTIYLLWREYNKADIAAEEAAEEAKKAKQIYQDLNTELETLKSNFSTYKEAKTALSELTKGTEEWKQAVHDTNAEVLELLENYPELSKYITRSSDGVLTISEEGMDALIEQKSEEVSEAMIASNMVQIMSNEADLEARRARLGRDVSSTDRGPFGSTSTRFLTDQDLELIEAAYNRGEDIWDREVLSNILGVAVTDPFIDAVLKSQDKIMRFLETKNAQNTANDIVKKETMQELLNQQDDYHAEDIQNNEALLTGLVNIADIIYEENIKDEQKKTIGDLAADYAEMSGYKVSEIKGEWTPWHSDDSATFINDEGEEVIVPREVMEESLASVNAFSSAVEEFGTIVDKMNGIDHESTVGQSTFGVSGMLFNPQNNFGVADVSTGQLRDIYNSTGGKQFTGADLNLDDATAQLYGYNTADEMAGAYWEAIAKEKTTRESRANSFSVAPTTSTPYEKVAPEGLSSEDSYFIKETPSESQTLEQDSIVSRVENIKELNAAFESGQISQSKYSEGLVELGGEYKDLEEETTRLKKAQENYTKVLNKENPTIEELTEAEQELSEAQEEVEASLVIKDWEKAASACEDYLDVINSAKKDSPEYANAIKGIEYALEDLLGVDIPQGFVEQHLPEIEDWISGAEGSGSRFRVFLGQSLEGYAQHANTLVNTFGTSAEAINAGLDGLDFNINGSADFSGILDQLGILNGEMLNSQEEAMALAQWLSSVGTTKLTFTGEGKTYDIDIAALNSDDAAVAGAEFLKLQEALSNFNANWHVSGLVPAAAAPEMEQINSGGDGDGGGGGGGGGKSYTPKTEKKSEEKADRYQDVNAHLDRLSNNLEVIADEQDRLAGKDMLENMAKQVELIKQQAEWHQKKLDIQKEEAAELRNELGQDYGITFDSEGFMTNYQEVHQKLVDEYNALVDQYNATSDEEGQQKIKEQMDAVKEKIDSFNEAWERYDELMNNEIPESMNTLEDLEDQIEDLRIEAFNAYIEAAENIKDIQDAWAEFVGFMSGLEPDSPFRSLIEDAEKYENSIDLVVAKQQDLDKLMQWAPQYQAGGVISSDNPFGENSAEYYEALQAAYESYIEAVLDAESLYYDQIDDIMEGYDEIVDKIEKRMEKYARLTERVDHYASVIETLYGDEDYDNLLALKRANQDILESSIEQSRLAVETLKAEYEKQKAAGILGEEQLEELRQHVVDAESELEGLVEEAAQNTAEILEMAVDQSIKKWKDAMLGGDANWMETQWELDKELAEQYLDTVEETYELEKLRSKYNNLANDTMDLNLRKRINEQMEKELAYLQEKDKLSQYDIDYANAKLEILQKQIALEEAQANKNQMKLRRDSQGNYSYVYAADQDNVAQAQSDLMDAEFNAYSMSKENYGQQFDNYLSYISNMADIAKQIMMDTTLDAEKKEERIAEIQAKMAEYIAGISDQLSASQRGMLESVAFLATDTTGLTGEAFKELSEMMQEDWSAAMEFIGVASNDTLVALLEDAEDFLANNQTLWDEFAQHTEEWAKNVQDIADDGTEGFRDIDDVLIDIRGDMKDLNDETETFFSLINDDLGTIDAAVGKLADYEKQIQGLKDSTSKTVAELEAARKTIIDKDNEIRDLQGEIDALKNPELQTPGNGDGGSGSGSGGGNGFLGTGYTKEQLLDGISGNTWYYKGWGDDPTRKKLFTQKFNSSFAGELQSYINKGMGVLKYGYSNMDKYQAFAPSKFDTGGYTGTWGKEGRLAMLHQKELVLNAQDTENILSAVGVIREIVAAMKSDSLSSLISTFKNNNIATNTGNNIEQNVSIYADFPAAESAAEIKAALEGLTQQAIQYAKRTR